MSDWLAIGPKENWELGIKRGIWGSTERYYNAWDKVKKDDLVFFYVTKPIKAIVGYGAVKTKTRATKPFWQQEIKDGEVLWPLQLKFDVVKLIPLNQWEYKGIPLPPLSEGIVRQSAFQMLKDKTAKGIIKKFK